ncbi:unnamed protein product [Spirodela intermedia]|uniref:Uncharacterized protein n=1 Tax=Spirodela intermedia TaxID=51605 RepID=A0A7I8KKP0_SPIIN|nr:unnamed protein product [Spirodela intermedia]
MGRQIVSDSCHPAEQKNGDFIVLFLTTACSSINRR